MTEIERIAAANTLLLKQLQRLLATLSDEEYSQDINTGKGSSVSQFSPVGIHVRHSLDHYLQFFSQLQSSTVNYDKRERSLTLESNRETAIDLLIETVEKLEELVDDESLSVHHAIEILDIDRNSDKQLPGNQSTIESLCMQSSVGRELGFLHAHTVHHMALIKMSLAMLGVVVDIEDFGMAPSTINHTASLCAR